MNLKTLRNGAIALGVVAGLLAIMWLVSTIVSAIVPITMTAVIAFILGRMSTQVNLFSLVERGLNRLQSSAQQRSTAKTEKTEEVAHYAASLAQNRAAEKLAPPPDSKTADIDRLLADEPVQMPAVKSEQEILAEAKRKEEEIAQQASAYDPKAAIEERKKRLNRESGNSSI